MTMYDDAATNPTPVEDGLPSFGIDTGVPWSDDRAIAVGDYSHRHAIADQTMTHVGDRPQNEINGNLIALNALTAIPLKLSLASASPPLRASPTTPSPPSSPLSLSLTRTRLLALPLDNDMANDWQPVLPGFWDIPMQAFLDRGRRDTSHGSVAIAPYGLHVLGHGSTRQFLAAQKDSARDGKMSLMRQLSADDSPLNELQALTAKSAAMHGRALRAVSQEEGCGQTTNLECPPTPPKTTSMQKDWEHDKSAG
ncbi:hypothetical protein R3P38DRAFT_3221868 [Favolaschia claudopus]|uniref:Uncharacterized protein n=1 Tax=Favolaschia claudopus TaxID=2862362 RepID=A0AAV9ZZQ0_9AGAR